MERSRTSEHVHRGTPAWSARLTLRGEDVVRSTGVHAEAHPSRQVRAAQDLAVTPPRAGAG